MSNAQNISEAKEQLTTAALNRSLTIIVGNGLSGNAAYESHIVAPQNTAREFHPTWSQIVRSVYKELTGKDSNANALVIAQSIAKTEAGRKQLLSAIAEEEKAIAPSRLHKMIAALNPSFVITTNYDLLLERTFEEFRCHVRAGWHTDLNTPSQKQTIIFKIHGTFSPQESHRQANYYSGVFWNDIERTIVIAENDYDECTKELNAQTTSQLLWDALGNTLLIVGKGVIWEDLSFMYALRRRAGAANVNPAYWLTSPLTETEELTLENLRIQPLTMKMPFQRSRDGAHHYFANERALEMLFGDRFAGIEKPVALLEKRLEVTRPPNVLAIGLSAYNTAGFANSERLEGNAWHGKSGLPREGRQNIGFEGVDQYAGGPALTAISVCAALIKSQGSGMRCAVASIIGPDLQGQEIRKFCAEKRIDDDAVAEQKGSSTWQSTILVHGCAVKDQLYAGQRLFLDMASKLNVSRYSEAAFEQLEAMFLNSELRVVYLDKWLAHPPGDRADRASHGFLSTDRARRMLADAIARDDSIDIVYESGSGGSKGFVVEDSFAHTVNIFTAAFPCFYQNIAAGGAGVHSDYRDTVFRSSDTADTPGSLLAFVHERAFINSMLDVLDLRRLEWMPVPAPWIERADELIRHGARRRWLIVTLHEFGALAIDLTDPRNARMRWCPNLQSFPQDSIQDTSGAGDVFRGALMFALLNESGSSVEALAKCCDFAVMCASRRCETHLVSDSLADLEKNGFDLWSDMDQHSAEV